MKNEKNKNIIIGAGLGVLALACIIGGAIIDEKTKQGFLAKNADRIAMCWQDVEQAGEGACYTEYIRDKNGDIIGLDIIRK